MWSINPKGVLTPEEEQERSQGCIKLVILSSLLGTEATRLACCGVQTDHKILAVIAGIAGLSALCKKFMDTHF